MNVRFRRALAGLGLAAALAAGVATAAAPAEAHQTIPAAAAAALSDCPSSSICLWSADNYSGTGRAIHSSLLSGGCFDLRQVSFDNVASSAYNRTSLPVKLWQFTNCTGKMSSISPGVAWPRLANRYIGDNATSAVSF